MQENLFLKWVGGKKRLINILGECYPKELLDGNIKTYVEPFLGAGSVFFDIAQRYSFQEAMLSDINPDLIITYNAVKHAYIELAHKCDILLEEYTILPSKEEKGEYYYIVRDTYNSHRRVIDYSKWNRRWIDHAAMFIFLNRTSYSSLYRVSSKGNMNASFGWADKIKMPTEETLAPAAELLSFASLQHCSFADTLYNVTDDTFIYCDPPYVPISETANFTGYSSERFSAGDQEVLAGMLLYISKNTNAKIMVSNSYNDTVLELYRDMNIREIKTLRSVRHQMENKPIKELIITNY